MNVIKLRGTCFNCNWGGSVVTFVKEYQKITWSEAYDIINFYTDFKPLPTDVFEEIYDKLYIEGKEVEIKKKYFPLPDDFKLLAGTTSLQATPFIKYARSRGLTDRQIEMHGFGFCPEGLIPLEKDGKMYLNNRLIIQTFEDSKPVYWMGRDITGKLKPKTLNPPTGVNLIGKSDIIFNFDKVKENGVGVITEGVYDATTIGDLGMALFGKTLSSKQLLKIVQSGIEKIYVMLDPDALDAALVMCEILSRYIKEVYLCVLKGGDPNEVGKLGCLEAIRNAERYDKLTALKYTLKL